MNTEGLIESIGYLACDLAKDLTDSDIQHDWQKVMRALGEEPSKLTAAQIDALRTYALP